jgi:hypothetical protein
MFNFLSDKDINVTVKLSRRDTHLLKHHVAALNNITHVTFEPYDPNSKVDSVNEYGKHIIKLRN